MKTAIYLTLIALVIPAIFFVYLLYVGHKAWERAWVKVESIQGPDGYTYCVMFETGLGQDPYTKLSRTKTPEDETTYEDLGSVNEVSSWLTVIRPVDVVQGPKRKLLLSSNQFIFIAHAEHTPFIYDIAANQFYESYHNNEMSPFILVDKQDAELYEPDIIPVILRIVERFYLYAEGKEYVDAKIADPNLLKDRLPDWPTPEALEAGLAHRNKEVRKIAGWLLEINNNGLSHDSEPIREVIDFLVANVKKGDSFAQYRAIRALGYFRNPYILSVIALLESELMSGDDLLSNAAAESLGKMGEPAFAFLLECLRSQDPVIRRLGLTGFSYSKEKAAVHEAEIKLLLNDNDAAVREQAANTLSNIETFCMLRKYMESQREETNEPNVAE